MFIPLSHKIYTSTATYASYKYDMWIAQGDGIRARCQLLMQVIAIATLCSGIQRRGEKAGEKISSCWFQWFWSSSPKDGNDGDDIKVADVIEARRGGDKLTGRKKCSSRQKLGPSVRKPHSSSLIRVLTILDNSFYHKNKKLFLQMTKKKWKRQLKVIA